MRGTFICVYGLFKLYGISKFVKLGVGYFAFCMPNLWNCESDKWARLVTTLTQTDWCLDL